MLKTKSLSENFILVVVILAVVVTVFGYLVKPGSILYSKHSDLVTQHFATKTAMNHIWESTGRLPFWRDDTGSGTVALTNPQSLFFFPTHLFYLWLPAETATSLAILLHFFFIGIGFLVLARVMRFSFYPTLFVSLAGIFSFKGMVSVYAGSIPFLPAQMLLPYLTASALLLWERPGLGCALFASAIGALAIQGGQFQVSYYLALFLFCLGGVRLISMAIGGSGRRAGRILLWFLIAVIGAIAISAYLWVPWLSDLSLLSRTENPVQPFRTAFEVAIFWLKTLLYPEWNGSPIDPRQYDLQLWERVAYFGIVPLLLALVGAVRFWRERPVQILVFAFLLSLLLSQNFFGGLSWLPGNLLFRVPDRYLYLSALFGILLSGITLNRFPLGRTAFRFLPLVLIVVICVEGAYYTFRYLETRSLQEVFPSPPFSEYLRDQTEPDRVAVLQRGTLSYGWAAPWGLRLINQYDPYQFKRYRRLVDFIGGASPEAKKRPNTIWIDLDSISRWDLLVQLNVKMLVSPRQLPAQWLEHVEPDRIFYRQPAFYFYLGLDYTDIYLYRPRRRQPSVAWVKKVVGVQGPDEAENQMVQNVLWDLAIVEGTPSQQFAQLGEVDHLVRKPGSWQFETRNRSPGFIRLSEVWHPGWEAKIDGVSTPIFVTNLALIGIFIPAGDHSIEVTFTPPYWRLGLFISFGSLLLWMAMLFYWRSRRGGVTPQKIKTKFRTFFFNFK